MLVIWGHKLGSVAASFFVMGAATRLYGLEQIGVWIFATALASYLAMLDFGTSSALPRIVPRLRQSGNLDAIHQIVSTAFSLAVVMAIVGLAVLLAFGTLSPLGFACKVAAALPLRFGSSRYVQ